MVLIRIITFAVLFYSCSGETSQSKYTQNIEDDWTIVSKSVSTHTYTPKGLLYKTFETLYFYNSGKIRDSTKSITVRQYRDSLLTSERQYTISDESDELISEKIKQYNLKGQLTMSLNKIGAHFQTKTVNEYDITGHISKSIHFNQTSKTNSYDNNLDSVMAHRIDKKVYEYDTTIESHTYDKQGNLIQSVQSNTKGIVLTTFIDQYYENQKTFTYTLNSQNDTLLKVTYQRENDFTKEIHIIKELGIVDTIWEKNDKIIKVIGHNTLKNTKNQTLYNYNAKNEEIESTSYE